MSKRRLIRLGILASGRGSNFEAIAQAIAQNRLDAEIRLLVSNNPNARCLTLAKDAGIPALCLSRNSFPSASARDRGLLDALEAYDVDLIALAGYLQLISHQVIAEFPGPILNIHPALLPGFGGPGMFGALVHRAVLVSGSTMSGVTIHVVDEHYDTGPIIVQFPSPVFADDDEDRLSARLLVLEHHAYPLVLQWFATGRIVVARGVVRWLQPLSSSEIKKIMLFWKITLDNLATPW